MDAATSDSDTKDCIWCGERIKAAARICRFCDREQADEHTEEVLYYGVGHPPIGGYVLGILLCSVVVGFLLLPYYWLKHKKSTYRITTRRVEQRSGILSTSVDVLELSRVTDIRYESSLGFGKVVLVASDATSPKLELPVPAAERVFERLKEAIPAERKRMGVAVRERV